MLRRIPSTPLVCLVVFLSTVLATAVWAAGPDESLEVLLKPGQAGATPVQATQKIKTSKFGQAYAPAFLPCAPMPVGISKVKALPACAPAMLPAGCILPRTAPGQWEMSVQAFFARTRGTVQWPRNNWWAGGWANREVDFNDDLQLPAHQVLAQFTAKYQFRPQWAIRYSILGLDLKGGGWNWNNWNQFYFGNQFFGGTNNINSEWQHLYQRVGVLYDAIRTCNSAVSIFTDWVHADDKITVGCGFCGWGASTLSKGTDAAIVGLEIERCMSTAWNGGTFSCDYKAGVIFLDDVEGVDAQAGCKYSIPMNYGRWGFVKGGYRYVELKKTQQDYLLKHALEGGFMELGVIF